MGGTLQLASNQGGLRVKEGEQEVEEEAEEELKGVMNNSVREQDVAQQVVAFGC